MRIVCAWCGKEMGQKAPLEDTGVTHAICPECFLKQTGKTPEESARRRGPLYPHVPKSKIKVIKTGDRELYYCAIEEYHPHSEIVQVETTEKNPKCPYCSGIMTLGKYW